MPVAVAVTAVPLPVAVVAELECFPPLSVVVPVPEENPASVPVPMDEENPWSVVKVVC